MEAKESTKYDCYWLARLREMETGEIQWLADFSGYRGGARREWFLGEGVLAYRFKDLADAKRSVKTAACCKRLLHPEEYSYRSDQTWTWEIIEVAVEVITRETMSMAATSDDNPVTALAALAEDAQLPEVQR